MNTDFFPGAGECQETAKRFSEPTIRINFMKKVFSQVGIQLLITSIICGTMIAYEENISKQLKSGGEAILLINTVLFVVLYLTLVCSKKLRHTTPTNYILLGLVTISMSITVGMVCQMYNISSIINAMVMTCLIVGAQAYYAFTTKKDITIGNVFMYILVIDMLHIFVWLFLGRFEFGNTMGSVLSATCFSLYLVHDLQTLMSGKRRQQDVDDYIFGALIIYMDIIQIFIKLLELFGEKKDEKEKQKK